MKFWSVNEWARRCGVSHQRAREVLAERLVPGAVEVVVSEDKSTWVLPEGTPWPFSEKPPRYQVIPPEGYIHVSTWAKQHGRAVGTVRTHLSKRSEEVKGLIVYRGQRMVPIGTPWPWVGGESNLGEYVTEEEILKELREKGLLDG